MDPVAQGPQSRISGTEVFVSKAVSTSVILQSPTHFVPGFFPTPRSLLVLPKVGFASYDGKNGLLKKKGVQGFVKCAKPEKVELVPTTFMYLRIIRALVFRTTI